MKALQSVAAAVISALFVLASCTRPDDYCPPPNQFFLCDSTCTVHYCDGTVLPNRQVRTRKCVADGPDAQMDFLLTVMSPNSGLSNCTPPRCFPEKPTASAGSYMHRVYSGAGGSFGEEPSTGAGDPWQLPPDDGNGCF